VGRGGGSVRVTCATEDAQMLVQRSRVEEGEVRTTSIIFNGRRFNRYVTV
jgi:hypothetical protein